jgi:hypothetical protein
MKDLGEIWLRHVKLVETQQGNSDTELKMATMVNTIR